MSGIVKKIEVTSNIAIIVAAIMIGVVIAQKYYVSKNRVTPYVPKGTKISLPNIDWSKNGQSLVLALQTGCHYCSESAPFYQRLASEMSARKIPLIAVLPQTIEEGQNYLNSLKAPIGDIRQAQLKSIGVQGTPTILLVDSNGEVKASWAGKLPPNKESEVLNSLTR
jgi:thioredoxin-related protein